MGNSSSSSSSSDTTTKQQFQAAVKELDKERKRLLHVSMSHMAQKNYIEQLEDIYLCVEKSLSAYPESDYQTTLIRGLHEKHQKTYQVQLKKWQGEEHAFHQNPNDSIAEDPQAKYKRKSFAEKVKKRASTIFRNNSKTKNQALERAEERRIDQRSRLEARLQARIDEQRKLELRGEKPTKTLKDAVKMLTKQILVFGKRTSQVVRPAGGGGDGDGDGDRGETKTRQKIDAGEEIFHPPPGIGNFTGHGTSVVTFFNEHMKIMDDTETPYMMLRKAFLRGHTFLTTNKFLDAKQCAVWVANLNRLVVLVQIRCEQAHGKGPDAIAQYIKNEFETITWKWLQPDDVGAVGGGGGMGTVESGAAVVVPKEYVAPSRAELLNWSMNLVDHFDKHHQSKVRRSIHQSGADMLYGEGGLEYEEMPKEMTAWEAFKMSQPKTKTKKKKSISQKKRPTIIVAHKKGQNPVEVSEVGALQDIKGAEEVEYEEVELSAWEAFKKTNRTHADV